jgi:hypothetical protein
MCPTTLGRVETRAFILIGPALLSLVLWLVTGSAAFPALIGIYLAQGWALDVLVYPRVISWQPPWLTGVLGVVEFVIVYVLAHALRLPISNLDAIWFYWVSWTIAVWTRIVVLPLLRLTWLEDGGEFRRIRWTVPVQREPEAAPSESTAAAPAPSLTHS